MEDLNMASINFHHFGAPKFWYGISRSDYKKFENFVKTRMPEKFIECNEVLRHKTTLINPYILKSMCPDLKIIKYSKKANSKTWRVYHHAVVGIPQRLQFWL